MEEKNKKDSKQKDAGIKEDSTKYGEFVSSYFGWIPPEKQKEKAEELQDMTKEKE